MIYKLFEPKYLNSEIRRVTECEEEIAMANCSRLVNIQYDAINNTCSALNKSACPLHRVGKTPCNVTSQGECRRTYMTKCLSGESLVPFLWHDAIAAPSGTRHVHLQLGANKQPLLPMDPSTYVLLVDASPDVVQFLQRRMIGPRCVSNGRCDAAVVWRAVSNTTGHVPLHIGSADNIGASLENIGASDIRLRGAKQMRVPLVPASPVTDILSSLPAELLPVEFVNSNIEGYDYTAFEQLTRGLEADAHGPQQLPRGPNQLPRGPQLVIAEMDANGYGTRRGAVAPNEFRDFDAHLARIRWRWVACVAGASHMRHCVTVGSDVTVEIRCWVGDRRSDPMPMVLHNGVAPAGFVLHKLHGSRLSVLINANRTVPISKLRLSSPEDMDARDRRMASKTIHTLLKRNKGHTKEGSYYHSSKCSADACTDGFIFRWVHCAMAPKVPWHSTARTRAETSRPSPSAGNKSTDNDGSSLCRLLLHVSLSDSAPAPQTMCERMIREGVSLAVLLYVAARGSVNDVLEWLDVPALGLSAADRLAIASVVKAKSASFGVQESSVPNAYI